MPARGISRGGSVLELSPVNQLNKPDEVELAATALEVAYLQVPRLPTRLCHVIVNDKMYMLFGTPMHISIITAYETPYTMITYGDNKEYTNVM